MLVTAAAWRLLDAEWFVSVPLGVLAATVYAWVIWRDLAIVGWILGGAALVLGAAGVIVAARRENARAGRKSARSA